MGTYLAIGFLEPAFFGPFLKLRSFVFENRESLQEGSRKII